MMATLLKEKQVNHIFTKFYMLRSFKVLWLHNSQLPNTFFFDKQVFENVIVNSHILFIKICYQTTKLYLFLVVNHVYVSALHYLWKNYNLSRFTTDNNLF